jgi:Domain of unknown function (DUF4832)/Domain of unknown function (DUF4874)/Secretion system C-terminal sorting domain
MVIEVSINAYMPYKAHRLANLLPQHFFFFYLIKEHNMKKTVILSFILFFLYAAITAQTVFSIRSSDGVILKNNQPFFPMGFYIDRGTVASYRTQVEAIALGGTFNVINLPYVGGEDAAWTSFLDLCASKNIYVISQLDYAAVFTGPVTRFKNHPAVCGWSVADDADNGYFTLAQLQERQNQIKAADPNHITDMSLTGYYLSRRQAANNFTPIPDVPSFQIYPISPFADYDVTSANALNETYLRTLLYVNSAALVNKSLLMNNQVFNWGTIGTVTNPRYPTAGEARNMVYSGIAAGIKGIISYVFSTALQQQTGLWNECKALQTDVNVLQQVLLNGTLTRVNTGDPELVCSRWEYNNECYIAVVNTSYSNSKSITVSIPAAYNGQAQPLFSRIPGTLSFSGNTLAGNIAATGVQVYKISTSGNTNTINYPADNTTNFTNPERGWHVQFETCADVNEQLDANNLIQIRTSSNISLVKKNYNLRLYKTAPIDQAFLTLLQNDFNACRIAGVKLIPLFRYNACEGQPAPNAPIERILEHMDQLGPVLTANKDVIAWMKAGFIGAYGEWHDTDDPTLLEMPKKGQILNKLLSVLPADRMVNLRHARDKRDIYNQTPITAAEAHGGTNKARVGHENDSYGSNAIDYGTYYFGEGNGQAEDIELVKNFLEQENNYVPQGGETSGLCGLLPTDVQYHQCDYALLTMKRLKYTSISHYELFDVNAPCNTIPIWAAGGCEPEMKLKLGYRFRLVDAQIPTVINTTSGLQMSFRVANDGWANPVNPRGVSIVLRNKVTNQEFFIPVTDGLSVPADRTLDPRFWGTNTITTVSLNKPLPNNIPAGNYDVLLHLFAPEAGIKSRPEYAIRLANQNVWEAATGYNSLQAIINVTNGVLTVKNDTALVRTNLNKADLTIYPNPARQNTTVGYSLKQASTIQVSIFDLLGKEIKQIVNTKQPKGRYQLNFNTMALTDGVYFIKIRVNGEQETRKLIIAK